jgi:hypothetical protein
MPESDSHTVLILLYTAVALLVLLLGMAIGIRRRLSRIESRMLEPAGRHGDAESALSHAETSAGGAFEAFLNEDPARRNLPKGEQFAEYRRWRQEKGLNWSNS